MNIAYIIEAIRANRVRITDHADEEAEADQLTFDEIYFSVLNGEIIEDYPNDKPYPSCLIYGRHLMVSRFIVFGRIMRKTCGLS